MPSILDSVMTLIGQGETVRKLSSLTGASADKVTSLVKASVPTVVGGLADKAATTDGAVEVAALVENATPQTDVTAPTKTDQGLVDTIFGDKKDSVVQKISGSTGVGEGVISKVLAAVAPLVLSVVAKRKVADNLDPAGVATLLANDKASYVKAAPVAAAGGVTNTAEETTNSSLAWLWWVLAAIIAVILALLALKSCGNDDTKTSTPSNTSMAMTTASSPIVEVSTTTVAADLQSQVNAALAAVPSLNGTDVKGTVADKIVTLTGTVPTDAAKAAAEAAVKAAGATSVVNTIVVGTTPVAPSASQSATTLNQALNLGPITFNTGSAVITPEGTQEVAKALAYLQANPNASVAIQGHTDNIGNSASNLALSQSRADAVKAYLVSKGIAADRMTAKGYGDTQPKVANDTSQHQAENRRIEIVVQ